MEIQIKDTCRHCGAHTVWTIRGWECTACFSDEVAPAEMITATIIEEPDCRTTPAGDLPLQFI